MFRDTLNVLQTGRIKTFSKCKFMKVSVGTLLGSLLAALVILVPTSFNKKD